MKATIKLTLWIGVILAVAVTIGLLTWSRHPSRPAAQSVSKPAPPEPAPLPKPPPTKRGVKMAIVTTEPISGRKVGSSAPSALAADWSNIQLIVNTNAGYRQRLDAVNSLSSQLTDADWKVLKQFLLKPDPLDADQYSQVIKNRLLDVLCAMDPQPAGLRDVLIGMYRDGRQHVVLRDYAVQHLVAYYEQLSPQADAAQEQQAIASVLREASNETGDSIGGTALLAMRRLSQEYTGFDQGWIAAAALQMANEPNACELTHITAYQVCAQLGVREALAKVWDAAQHSQTESERISAIGALGALGDADQIPFLNKILQGNDNRLKPPARLALDRIQNRLRTAGRNELNQF